MLPGGGHVLFEEMPEECNRIVASWLRDGRVAEPPRIPVGTVGGRAKVTPRMWRQNPGT